MCRTRIESDLAAPKGNMNPVAAVRKPAGRLPAIPERRAYAWPLRLNTLVSFMRQIEDFVGQEICPTYLRIYTFFVTAEFLKWAATGGRPYGYLHVFWLPQDFSEGFVAKLSSVAGSQSTRHLHLRANPAPIPTHPPATAYVDKLLIGELDSCAFVQHNTCRITMKIWKSDAMKKLTDRQQAVLDIISANILECGYPPTIREIAEKLGISSPNGVNDHLKALEKKGFISRSGNTSRGLRLEVPAGSEPSHRSVQVPSIPLVGQVAAGVPILAAENIEDHLAVDPNLVRRPEETFALRVKGDSMKDAGILNGDTVFVRQQADAREGQMVVAMIDGEATVKYFYRRKDAVELRPANELFSSIIINAAENRDLSILGVITHCFRCIDN